ncbi:MULTISPECIES: type III secretion system export apparatus subunit SctT [Lysobacter]|jgi:type III secretion protein T|uniref:Type III secretion system export apparatus subunit SctT n=1 Tax=Lysobacter gummosus TaxID=262324 RepID=A0ABY3XDF4_9GAMM|nr:MULTISPECIES: type III secretion system export apparatus subunit SctT [Lysobacter]ALN89200.1 type III secretion apparatus protein SpaR/YscT/HrcT [Lysobacter gummosus]UJB18863.1 type III secretion system export apparatus subunit SctT [Lysobacter capsici]UJQ27412.1 type III secretion system export apparatus subunit SctT [Lysobacter gummosus]UNP29889.1 type III secretion system export apparatus subunit SctT [Lysobacter gummosus]
MNIDSYGNVLIALGLVLPRVIGSFMMLPLITSENMPPLVRNSFMVSLAIIAIPVAMNGVPLNQLSALNFAPIILKELFIGVSIGFCFGMVFWAISAAGNVVDTQVGMTLAQVFDPIQGHQASLHGTFLSQFAAWLFMASGAFLVFLDLLLSSYAMWPVVSFFPNLHASGMELYVGQFSYLMTALLVMAAPVMVVLLLIDLSFGLVNRFAPQLNVFTITMPIKAWLATWIILLMLGVYVEIVLDRLGGNRSLLQALHRVFGG